MYIIIPANNFNVKCLENSINIFKLIHKQISTLNIILKVLNFNIIIVVEILVESQPHVISAISPFARFQTRKDTVHLFQLVSLKISTGPLIKQQQVNLGKL